MAEAPKAAEPAAAPKAEKPKATEEKKQKAKAKPKAAASAKKAAGKTRKFAIDCTEPVDDDIFDIASFEKFLHDRIKVGGKTGVLGEKITIARDGNSISVTVKDEFSKRYLKYLTKKFLKKQQLRDYIRVISRSKAGYYLRYFNLHQDEEAEADS